MKDDKPDQDLSQASDEEPRTAGAPAEGTPAEEAREDEVPEGEPSEAEPLPEQARSEPGTEVSDDLWNRRSTFFRATSRTGSPVEGQDFEPGRRWTTSEADRQIRAFLMRLAGDRRLAHRTDPTDLVRENDLLLLSPNWRCGFPTRPSPSGRPFSVAAIGRRPSDRDPGRNAAMRPSSRGT